MTLYNVSFSLFLLKIPNAKHTIKYRKFFNVTTPLLLRYWIIFTSNLFILFFGYTLQFYITFNLFICITIDTIKIFNRFKSWEHTNYFLSFFLYQIVFFFVVLLIL